LERDHDWYPALTQTLSKTGGKAFHRGR